MSDEPARVGIQVSLGDDAASDEVDAATRQLRRELLELEVDAVEERRDGHAPPGTRAIDPVAIGGLIVTVTSSKLFTAVVATIRTWLAGQHQPRSISLEIDGDVLELTGLSSAEQTRLADEWLARHAPQDTDDG